MIYYGYQFNCGENKYLHSEQQYELGHVIC